MDILNLNFVTFLSGKWAIYIPVGSEEPPIVKPNIWVGAGSSNKAHGLRVTIGSAWGDERDLLILKGWDERVDIGPGDSGTEILCSVNEEHDDIQLEIDLLKFWLGQVYNREIVFKFGYQDSDKLEKIDWEE